MYESQIPAESKLSSIEATLMAAGIDTSVWGEGDAKTLEHLIKEVREGDSILEKDDNGELFRTVRVAGVDVYYLGSNGAALRLVEDKQVFHDGRTRQRDLPSSVSEKMMRGEGPDEAAIRAIQEELGIDTPGDVLFKEQSDITKLSPSFPGLPSRYIRYSYECTLTEGQYRPEGYQEVGADKTTHFVWEPLH